MWENISNPEASNVTMTQCVSRLLRHLARKQTGSILLLGLTSVTTAPGARTIMTVTLSFYWRPDFISAMKSVYKFMVIHTCQNNSVNSTL